jgi:hypothetical protein
MKNLRFVLIAAFSLMLTATSCKKETVEPTPAAAPVAPVVTYGSFSVTVGCIDNTSAGWPATYSGAVRKVYSRCGSTILDSLIGIPLTYDAAGADPCAMTSLATLSKSFKTQDGSTNYIDVYEGNTLLVTAELITSPTTKISVTYREPSTQCYNIPGCPTLCAPIK